MMRFTIRDVLFCCLLLAAGCSRSSPAIVQIVIERPNTEVVDMDEKVAYPLMLAVAGAPHVSDVQSLSYLERTQVYVTLTNSDSIGGIAQRARDAVTKLPGMLPDCRLVAIERLRDGESIPAPESGKSEHVDIRVKPDELLKGLGISAPDVKEAIQQTTSTQATSKAPLSESMETLKDLEVTVGTRQFVFRDIADIQIVKAPKCIPRDFKGRR